MIENTTYKYDYDTIVRDYKTLEHNMQTYKPRERGDCNYHVTKFDIYRDGILHKDAEGTIYERIIKDIGTRYNIKFVSFRGFHQNECYTWHIDGHDTFHLPVTNSPHFFYIFEDKHYTMDADGSIYFFKSSGGYHSACNAGTHLRVNLFIAIDIIP